MEMTTTAVKKMLLAAFVLPGLLACDSSLEDEEILIRTDSVTAIPLPQILRSAANVDPGEFQLTAYVGNSVHSEWEQADGLWSAVIDVPRNESVNVSVEWGLEFGTTGYVKLAEQRGPFLVPSAATTVTLFEGNYDTDFDDDNDTFTNLDELNENRNPVDPIDVHINVGGSFDESGKELRTSGDCGELIPITAITERPAQGDVDAPAPEFEGWWCAKLQSELTDADGNVVQMENIEITVNVVDENIVIDSRTTNNFADHLDDSIEIFIDGNNSKSGSYSDANDYQFRFSPLGDGVVYMAKGSSEPVNLSGQFTYPDGGYQLKAILPLRELGIGNGQPFGLNVQVNDDDDGNVRDYAYSWIGADGVDLSFRNTRAFGTAQVPFLR